MSDTNKTSLVFQAEPSWGTAPAPVVFKKLRHTKSAIKHEKKTVRSAEIREDRNQSEAVEVGVEAKGSFDFELTVDHEAFLQAALFGVFGAEATDVLINGSTEYSFLLEQKLTDAAFISFPGMMIDELTLNVPAHNLITGSLSMLGKQGVSAAATLDTGGSYTDAGTAPILSASGNVGNLLEGGVALGSVKSISLTAKNTLRSNEVVASKTMEEIGVGAFDLTGKIEVYFRTRTLFEKFVNHTLSSLSFQVSRESATAVTGDIIGYQFDIPALRYTGETPTVPGKDQDVMLPLEFSAEAYNGAFAVGTLTMTGNAIAAEQVVVGGKTYIFRAAVGATANEVKIGATASDTLDNLIAAINAGTNSPQVYGTATLQNNNVSAAAGAGDTLITTALSTGVAGNSIASTETLTNGSWGAATLAGGATAHTLKITRLRKV